MTQMGGNSMNIIQSLGAAMVPGLQGALLGTMGRRRPDRPMRTATLALHRLARVG